LANGLGCIPIVSIPFAIWFVEGEKAVNGKESLDGNPNPAITAGVFVPAILLGKKDFIFPATLAICFEYPGYSPAYPASYKS
jgi:hypothetical protein